VGVLGQPCAAAWPAVQDRWRRLPPLRHRSHTGMRPGPLGRARLPALPDPLHRDGAVLW